MSFAADSDCIPIVGAVLSLKFEMTKDLTIPKFGVLSYSSSTSTVYAVQVQYRRLLLYERVLQYCCCCEGGDCCFMNECYNIVVVVKVATVVV